VELTIVTPAIEVVQDVEVRFEAGGQNSNAAVNEDFNENLNSKTMGGFNMIGGNTFAYQDFNENLEKNTVGGFNMAGGNAAIYQAFDENLYVMEDSLLMNPTTIFYHFLMLCS